MTTNSLPTETYQAQFEAKQARLTALLAPFNAPALQAFASQPQHYRMRAEFRIWHDGDDLYQQMFDKENKRPYRVDQFPVASRLINDMMRHIMPLLRQEPILRKKLFQIDYLSTQSQKIIVSLLYHCQLEDDWLHNAKRLQQHLQTEGFDVEIIGRARKQKLCTGKDYADEVLHIKGRDYTFRQVENSFTQPNAEINQKMIEWALDCTQGSTGDLLELYCGNGNFSLPLAQNFRKVLATEIAKPSVNSAQYNIAINQIDNVEIIRMAAEEFTQAINGERTFKRLRGIDLTSYECNTIVVDPPRSGLDPETLNMVQGYNNILYISCNPHTLVDNLQQLSETHNIQHCALFDQFPYTDHMESGVYLVRK